MQTFLREIVLEIYHQSYTSNDRESSANYSCITNADKLKSPRNQREPVDRLLQRMPISHTQFKQFPMFLNGRKKSREESKQKMHFIHKNVKG
uniref:Uncharacterized protein n=1 Tax=Rhizophora mucronata TaxID=61149 RepID=A0A2P2J6F1_RHIMU